MADRDKILCLLFEVVEAINALLPEEEQILEREQTQIFGIESGLDSLTLLDLILGVEQKVTETTGMALNLGEVLVGNESGRAPATLGELASLISRFETKP